MMFRAVATLAIALTTMFHSTLLAWQPPAGGQGEFVPIDQLPAAEQLPAAPLLIAAYTFVWLAAIFYLWSIWRRLNKVEDEMRALERRRS